METESRAAAAVRRSYGTGSLYVYKDRTGAESWYARWWTGGQRVKRRVGPKRRPGSRDGLTRAQAERELRRLIEHEQPAIAARIDVEIAGARLLSHLETLGRKPTTLATYRSLLRTHLVKLGEKPLERVAVADVERLISGMRRNGTGPKTTRNALALLSQIFRFAQRRGWCRDNPCLQVDAPKLDESADIRFLDEDELAALLRGVPESGHFASTDRTLFLVAAMTGLRQGELLALRWRDVDWAARKIRVRRNFVRGHWGTPKSRRGSRSVPMADRVGSELQRHFQRSSYRADDDLVFCHPQTGSVLNHSKLVRRFKRALKAAGVRTVRFNDLRHTFGTRMAAAGVPLRTLQEWMGHRDIKTTQIYADYQPDDRREAELVERAFADRSAADRNQ